MAHTTPSQQPSRSRPPRASSVAVAEPRGCLFALSQPPLMLFLTVVGGLIALTGGYDLIPW
ncbi:hypothetical protein ACFQLX_06450 [Streptomyces polyrhachis]|uniref:Uncharacterized protein n=1 Tax=Streptomyces polyrhachis TaxID=1282885 RepID=A0ABW2GG86_9ACTN